MPSSKRELQRTIPRPPPLKVAKDSFKAKKPAPSGHRSPVIVHMHSPKVIHARPQDFMRVVQLLTGKSSSFPPTYGPIYHAPDINEACETEERSRSNPNDLVREFRFY